MRGTTNAKLTVAAVALVALATAQTGTPARPKFEVASIKPNKETCCAMGGAGVGGASEREITLKFLIAFAWRLQEFQISGGPGWISSDRFDFEAKAADRNASPDQVRLMLQSLLEDRFKLKSHREMKETSVYELVVGKDGPKIKLSADQTSPSVDGPSPPGAALPNRGVYRFGPGSIVGNAVPLSLFTKFLSQRLDRLVIDKTNLGGRFDIQMLWTPGLGENPIDPGGNAMPPADSSHPSIFVAIQEQLGLRLESAQAPAEVLVIDHVEQPTPD